MAACGARHYQEDDEEFFSIKRIDLSFSNAGSNHLPAKKNLGELVLMGTPIPLKKEPEILILNKLSNREHSELGEESSEGFDIDEKEMERQPTTLFSTRNVPRGKQKKKKKDSEVIREVDENKVIEAAQRLEKVGAISKQELEVPMDTRGRRQTLVTTATGKVISKKLATAEELEGCIIAHVFFCTMRGNKNFPPLIISIPKDWPFIKMIRKALAGMQKTLRKGERPSHDWIYNYHVNKDKPKIMKELKVLVGDKKVEYRGSNLKKKLESAALEPFVNRFWVLPKKPPKSKHYRGKVW